MTEASYPVKILGDHAIARWARQHDVAIDVRTTEELGVAIANGVKPTRIVVHGDTLCDTELRCVSNLGVGRVIVGTITQAQLLGASAGRVQPVLVRMTDPVAPGITKFGFPFATDEADTAIRTVLAQKQFRLTGLHVKVGSDDHNTCITCPAVAANLIAEMEQIHRHHGPVLTRLGFDCATSNPNWGNDLRELAARVDEAVNDACAALRFPRPRVLLSAGVVTHRSLAA
jgi:diaminopimelate decarboxylase